MSLLHGIAILLWSGALTLLFPPLIRTVCRRPRYLDSLWVICLIGVCNRLALATLAMPKDVADLAAASLAAFFTAVVWSYQRADR